MAFFKSIISKLKTGLSKTREVLTMDVMDLIRRRKLDAELINEVEVLLLQADVGTKATSQLIDTARADFKSGKMKESSQLLDHLKSGLRELLGGPQTQLVMAPEGQKPTVILVTGINGAGKTTTIAKLTHYLKEQNLSVLLGACDTFRAGAVRQLEIWGERLGVEVVKGQQGGDPAAVAFDATKAAISRGKDVLILDTAGRLHTQDPLMRQLAKIRSVVAKQIPGAPHETLLVLDATTGQNATRQAEEFGKHTQLSGIVLTKLDGTAKGGVVIAVKTATQIPVKFIGVGERPEDLQPFDPEMFVEALFGE